MNKATFHNTLRCILYLMFFAPYVAIRLTLRLLLGKNKRDLMQKSLPVLIRFKSFVDTVKFCLPISLTNHSFSLFSKKEANLLCLTKDSPFISDMWREIWELNTYERKFKIEEGSVVIDVGAHIGIFSIKAARESGKKGRVIAIEPHPTTYTLLMANLKRNRCENIIPFRMAASNFKGEAELYLYHHSGGHSLVFKRNSGVIKVSVDKLDNIVKKFNPEHIDLIKVDVEGAGLLVLKGAKEILEKFKPNLSIAVYHASAEREGIIEFLSSRGYSCLQINSSYIYACPQSYAGTKM